MTWFDYSFVALMAAFMIFGVMKSRSYMRGVSDFLAAGRTAGRYLICVSEGIAGLGAITIVANFEMYYQSGFPMIWWNFFMAVVVLLVTVSGWVVYRFRQTRALTMAQFFEERYSRRFRVFTGLIAWLSGIVNYGIYPAVGARFFIYFCGLPPSFHLLGVEVSTFVFLMALLLATALFFVFVGGQIAVIFTDFIQGIFVNAVFIVITVLFLLKFDYSTVFETLSARPAASSFLDPMKTGATKDFNFWFFLIGVVGYIYNRLSWQGTQGYNASASSAHEARMGQVLTNWRQIPQIVFMLFVALCAYTVMHNPLFAGQAAGVRDVLASEANAAVQSQLTVPVVLSHLLPAGLMGAFAAVMLGAFVTTNDTYLHSWGSIFVQDVILPLRRKPFTPRQHILALRLSILFVALFAFCFSLVFQQTEYILLFFAVTGAIYAGGSGSVIIGGLYWKRGTTQAAWGAMITGSVVSVGGIVCQQCWPRWFDGASFPVNGQIFWLIAILSSVAVYLVLSLFGGRREYDMDRLLHRGGYAVADEGGDPPPAADGGGGRGEAESAERCFSSETLSSRMLRGIGILFGRGKEFTRGDRLICLVTYAWVFSWFLVFVAGMVWHLCGDIPGGAWMVFWYVFVISNVMASIAVIFWFTAGGVVDIKRMFGRLGTMERDAEDDGAVRGEGE